MQIPFTNFHRNKISKINNTNIVDTALNASNTSETINESSNIIVQSNSSYFKNPISSLFNYIKTKIISSINTANDNLRNALISWLQGSTLSTVDTTNKLPINSSSLTTQLNDSLADLQKWFILSDCEDITLSTDKENPTIIQYDGFLIIQKANKNDNLIYINDILVVDQTSDSSINISISVTIPIQKDDKVYVYKNSTSYHNITNKVRFYKFRNYSNNNYTK